MLAELENIISWIKLRFALDKDLVAYSNSIEDISELPKSVMDRLPH